MPPVNPFLRKILKDVLHQNGGSKTRKKKTQDMINGNQHRPEMIRIPRMVEKGRFQVNICASGPSGQSVQTGAGQKALEEFSGR